MTVGEYALSVGVQSGNMCCNVERGAVCEPRRSLFDVFV